MRDPLIIGLAGRAGAGKDTVGMMLTKHDFGRLAFADPLRTMISALLGSLEIDLSYMIRRDRKESPIPQLGVSYRHLVQTLGTEWGRNAVAPDFWVRAAKASLDDFAASYDRVVFTDVRFINEVEAIQSWGGIIVWVDRDQAPPIREHISEQQLTANYPGIYARINNSGSREETWEQVCRIVSRLELQELES